MSETGNTQIKRNYDEQLSVLVVFAGCVLIGVAAWSFLIGIGVWFCVGGTMICLKRWIKEQWQS